MEDSIVDAKSEPEIKKNYLSKVGKNLLAIRKSQKMSQEDFAKQLNLSVRAYGSYERGEREMRIFLVAKIQKFTKMNPLSDEKIAVPCAGEPSVKLTATTQHLTWVSRLNGYRSSLIAARQSFENKRFSSSRRKLIQLREALQVGSSLAVCLKLYVPESSLFGAPSTTHPDWSLLLSFGTMTITTLFQLLYFSQFYLYRRQNQFR
jgi:transcriptional regulator with XRE-family HTH domain